MENIIIRVDKKFNEEMEDIKKERLERKIDKKKISTRALTSLIPRHKLWRKRIKEDIIKYTFKKENNFKDEENE